MTVKIKIDFRCIMTLAKGPTMERLEDLVDVLIVIAEWRTGMVPGS